MATIYLLNAFLHNVISYSHQLFVTYVTSLVLVGLACVMSHLASIKFLIVYSSCVKKWGTLYILRKKVNVKT